jgi:hypothetical protein
MQEAITRIRSGYGSADVGEHVEASRQLYSSLVDSVDFHIRAIRETLGKTG